MAGLYLREKESEIHMSIFVSVYHTFFIQFSLICHVMTWVACLFTCMCGLLQVTKIRSQVFCTLFVNVTQLYFHGVTYMVLIGSIKILQIDEGGGVS